MSTLIDMLKLDEREPGDVQSLHLELRGLVELYTGLVEQADITKHERARLQAKLRRAKKAVEHVGGYL